MTGLQSLLLWLESSSIAEAVGQSIVLTSWLSALHLVGMTVVVGSILVSALRLLGLLLADEPVAAVADGPARGVWIGLAISLTTGVLLVAPRATSVAVNEIFQIKMLLLALGIVFHAAHYRGVARGTSPIRLPRWLSGLAALVIWVGVAAAGCAYILLE